MTVTLRLDAHGEAPPGLAQARVKLERLELLVAPVDDPPRSAHLLDHDEPNRVFDLLALDGGAPVAIRDVRQGRPTALHLAFETDHVAEQHLLPLAPGAPAELTLPLPDAGVGQRVDLDLSFDLSASLVRQEDGSVALNPAVSVGVLP